MKGKKNMSREWHLKKMIDGMEKVRKHAREILVHESESMQQLDTLYLVVCQQHLKELKKEKV